MLSLRIDFSNLVHMLLVGDLLKLYLWQTQGSITYETLSSIILQTGVVTCKYRLLL